MKYIILPVSFVGYIEENTENFAVHVYSFKLFYTNRYMHLILKSTKTVGI